MSKLEYHTLRENVVKEIRDQILNRELKPGMRIVEQNLSKELNVSRGPIREALRQLEQEGLVEYTRNIGCSVKEATIKDLYEIYLLRSTYEILAVRLSGGDYIEEDIRKMEEILRLMENLDNYEEVVNYDHRLHRIIVEKASSERLTKLWSDLDYGSIISCYIYGFDETDTVKRQYKIHRELVDALETKNVETICDAIHRHYMNSVRHFMQQEGLPEDTFNMSGSFI